MPYIIVKCLSEKGELESYILAIHGAQLEADALNKVFFNCQLVFHAAPLLCTLRSHSDIFLFKAADQLWPTKYVK